MTGYMTHFSMRRSIHGRALGISTTGGVVSLSPGSTDVSCSAQWWGPGMFETVSAAGSTLANYGVSIISTASTAGATYQIAEPVVGVSKTIVVITSSTSMSLNSGGALFQFSSAHFSSSLGSTILTYLSASATSSLSVIQMVGITTGRWLVTAKPAWVTT